MSRVAFVLSCLAALPACLAAEGTIRKDGVSVSYAGIDRTYAEAIARTVGAARALAAEQFGFDMPKTITVSVRAETDGVVRLYTDGADRFFLTVRSQRDLRKPAASGIFHLYGLCHEVGHLAMYRLIRDHSWLTTAAAEGWAHYMGSRLVDAVHKREGKDLWPDAYDYLADGTKRLNRQISGRSRGDAPRGAKLWQQLGAIIGDKGFVKLFKAWSQAKVDPTDPAAALGKALSAVSSDKRLAGWWARAGRALILKRPRSGFAARTAKPDDLTGKGVQLAGDDGTAAGKRSIAGSGHAVRLASAGPGWYLTGVKVFGACYGRVATTDSFRLWLCDKEFRPIASFVFPYGVFPYGRQGRWAHLAVKPTQVPAQFIVCVSFNPTASKGVFVYHDAQAGGNSLTGLPGRAGQKFTGGDWLVRAEIDQLKTADALKAGR